MTQRTVAVVGIGFAPKKSPEAQKQQPKEQEIAPVCRAPRAPIPAEIEAPADVTDPHIAAGLVGETVTVAVVGIGFAPEKSK